jgi:hypothetical protein
MNPGERGLALLQVHVTRVPAVPLRGTAGVAAAGLCVGTGTPLA